MELNSGLNGFDSCLVIGKVNDLLARIIKKPYRNIILSALKEQRDGEKRKKNFAFLSITNLLALKEAKIQFRKKSIQKDKNQWFHTIYHLV